VLDEGFCVFAIRVCSPGSVGRRKLVPGKLYYLLEGFSVFEDRILISREKFNKSVHDYYHDSGNSGPHVTVSAIVGENGAGKSSLIEYEMRLINNFSTALFGEYAKVNGWPHLHYINGVDGELYYLHKQNVLHLRVKDRKVSLFCYYKQEGEEDGCYVFKQPKEGPMNLLPAGTGEFERGKPVRSPFNMNYFEGLKEILPRFFYTVVLNQSVYAYNTNDFWRESNTQRYEVLVRHGQKKNEKGERIPYSTEDKSWLNGLFHKNDGYQIPLVLTPFRKEGNYDINVENRLAYERLMSIMVRQEGDNRVINGHLRVSSFRLRRNNLDYELAYIHHKLGYRQFSREDFEKMSAVLLSTWSELIGLDLTKAVQGKAYGQLAINYLVYKTLKIAYTYDEYRDYNTDFNAKRKEFNEKAFRLLVQKTIANYSHVSSKLYRTVAYLIWDVYELEKLAQDKSADLRVDEINRRWVEAFGSKKIDITDSIGSSLILESALAPPFLDITIGMEDVQTGAEVPFEYLSSGEKQQAYTISSLVYHLKNLDSVSRDASTNDRVAYDYVQLILEEVELYYHPELQRQFVRNLLDGIGQAGLSFIKSINVCIVTHSPFVLSDIPQQNVLALRKDNSEVQRIPSFGANIHEMLKLSFFLERGTVGDFAQWTITRIAQCLRVHRWLNGIETPPSFFPSLDGDLGEYSFLEDLKLFLRGGGFTKEGFDIVYPSSVLLSQINLIEEPVVRRVLLDDYRRTFPDKKEEYKESMRALLQKQMDALEKL
jgi:hypothetical protein